VLLCPVLQASVPSSEQFKLLHERFPTLSSTTKGLLLSAYLKMLLHDASNAGLQAEVVAVFSRHSRQLDPELQQRSTEYLVGTIEQKCDTAAVCLCLLQRFGLSC
jgi:AP-2 complex subunit alpha